MPSFSALEHRADGSVGPAEWELAERPPGWEIRRDGARRLVLGPGYRLLRTSHCGVCATDLARHHLPFPLPQVTGHEVVALGDDGGAVAVEINASHRARGLPRAAWCGACAAGMPTHCANRLVLGIHGLPGGFSPWLLAPADAIVPLPSTLDPLVATLLEPFAAAWHAVETIAPAAGATVAVLGPGRLGSLVLAALAAYRGRRGGTFAIAALVRRPEQAARARALGADVVADVAEALRSAPTADVVVETTGSPEGFAAACRLAAHEVHLKSTPGVPVPGLAHATAAVVDELRLVPAGDLPASLGGRVAVVLAADADGRWRAALEERGARVVGAADAAALRRALEERAPLGAADLVLAATPAQVDAAIRPEPGVERGLVRPRGLVVATAVDAWPRAAAARGHAALRITTSRCGDLRAALPVLAAEAQAGDALRRLVTHVVPASRLGEGYAAARSRAACKVVIRHEGGLVPEAGEWQ